MTDPIDEAGKALGVVGQLASLAGQSPEMREAGTNVGKSVLTISETIQVVLLPFAAVNFGVKRAKVYFQEMFAEDLAPLVSGIPPESLVEPKASLVGPAIQGIAYSHEEQPLKDMYLRLIATAMDGRESDRAHPAYVEIIRQLDAAEAIAFREITKVRNLALAEIQIFVGETPEPAQPYRNDGPYDVFKRHVVPFVDSEQKPLVEPRMSARIDNWIRLGLIEVSYTKSLSQEGAYDWVPQRPEYWEAVFEAVRNPGSFVDFAQGYLTLTDFGKRFADAVGLIDEGGEK